MRSVLTQSSKRLATSAWGAFTTSKQHQYQIAVGQLQLSTTSQNDDKNTSVAPPSRSSLPARLRQAKPPLMPAERQDWVEVVDKQSGQIYYWNKSTDETTAIGEPRPGPAGRVQRAGPSFGMGSSTSYVGLVAMGAGVGLVFGILGKLIG